MQTTISITDCGARGGEVATDNIQRAIDTAAGQGGGTVIVPDGEWISGTIFLKSGVTLHVSPNAVLKASGALSDFPEVGESVAKGDRRKRHFIVAHRAENVTITGGGIIDGNGPAFWEGPRESGWIRAKADRVSPMLDFSYCQRLVLENIRIHNSPGWTVHPLCCDDVTLHGVRVVNDLLGPNTDGFDINGCRDVFISDCHLICGDDAIVLKAAGWARSTERVCITNCVVKTNCIGVGLGQETESDIRQVTVSNCVMYNCQRMVAINNWAGGVIEDVTITGIVGDTLETFPLARPIHIEPKAHVGWDVPMGSIRNVTISNFLARTTGRVLITAQEGAVMDGIVLRDIRLHYEGLEDAAALSPESGSEGSSQYSNRNLEARKQNAAFVVENASNLVLEGLYVRWPEKDAEGGDLPYGAIWARNVRGGKLNLELLEGLNGAEAAVLDGVEAKGVHPA